MEKKMKKTMDCAERSSVRFNDNQGCDTKFYKTGFRNELKKELYHFCVKSVEQLARGFSPNSEKFQKKFQKFQRVSQGLKLEALPEGYQSFPPKEKGKAVKKLVDEVVDELAAAMSHGPVQADDSNNMQVGAGNARQFDKTVREVKNPDPGEIQVDEVLAAAPNPDSGSTLSNITSLQNVTGCQCDNSQGQSPSRPPFPLEEIVFYLNVLMLRASRFPGILPKFEWSEASFRSFVIKLESLEGVLTDDSTTYSISHQMELYPSLGDSSAAYEAVTSMPSMEESLENEIWGYLALPRPEAPGTSPNLYAL